MRNSRNLFFWPLFLFSVFSMTAIAQEVTPKEFPVNSQTIPEASPVESTDTPVSETGLETTEETSEDSEGFGLSNESEGLEPGEGLTLTFLAKGSGVPIERLEVTHGQEKLYSNEAGVVRIRVNQSVPTIRFYRRGYETATYTIEALGSSGNEEIFMFPELTEDAAIVIRGRRKPEVSKKSIAIKEAASVAAGGDPVKVTQLLPGVQESNSFDSRVIIRGSGPDDSIYYLDEVPLPFIFHAVGGLSIIPEQLLEEVEFSSGGFGPESGYATGGVIKLRTTNDIPERESYDLRLNVPIYSSVFYEKPLSEDSSISVSLRRSYLESFVESAIEAGSDGQDLTLVPYFGDAYIRYLSKGENSTMKVTAFHSLDGIKLAVPSQDLANEEGKLTAEINLNFTGLSVERKARLNRSWRYTSSPYFLNFSQNTDFFGNRINIDVDTIAVPTEFSLRLDRKTRFYLGAELGYRKVDVDLLVPIPDRTDPFFDIEEAPKVLSQKTQTGSFTSLWLSSEIQTESDWTLAPGLRLQQDSSLEGKLSVDPRFNFVKKITNETKLKGAVGQYSDIPAFDESDSDFGSTSLDFEKSRHFVLGVEKDWGELWTSEVQLFHKVLLDSIVASLKAEENYDNSGKGRTSGLEVFIRRNLSSRLFGWLAYTYSVNEFKANHEEPYYPADFDQTHVLTLVGSYKMSSTWELGGRATYASGNRYTPVNDAFYNANLDKYQPQVLPDQKNQERLPAVSKMSIYSSHKSLFDRWQLEYRFGVEDYIIGKDARNISYNYDYSKKEFASLIPFIPYIEVRATL